MFCVLITLTTCQIVYHNLLFKNKIHQFVTKSHTFLITSVLFISLFSF
nr:MAG TPA: hypothetical protein [Caudoviricetes sp.]